MEILLTVIMGIEDDSLCNLGDKSINTAWRSNVQFERGPFESGEEVDRYKRWEKYVRDLKLNIQINDIKDDKKSLYFLAVAGQYIQELNERLPEYDESKDKDENKKDKDDFDRLLWRFESHFKPKYNEAMEKLIFRQIKQESNESIEDFILRLRHQANRCKFTDEEGEIKTQVIINCKSHKLQEKLLERDMELHEVIQAAKLYEMKDRYLQETTGKQEVFNYAVHSKHRNSGKQRDERTCFACGRKGHVAKNVDCPARNKRCRKCDKLGHFDAVCKSKTVNRYSPYSKQKQDTKNLMTIERNQFDDQEETKYLFALCDKSDDVTVSMGGVAVSMLIDTGADLDCITKLTWEYLKDNNIKAYNQVKGCDQKIFAYGTNEKIDVLGTFKTTIDYQESETDSVIYVCTQGKRNIMSRDTALKLDLISFNIIQEVKLVDEELPTMKGL